MSPQSNPVQRTRWTFKLQIHEEGFDFRKHLLTPIHKIKRAVWGYEREQVTGTRLTQGYIEFVRSVRLSHCRRIFDSSHWKVAENCSRVNFDHCIEGRTYDTIGNFDRELHGHYKKGYKQKKIR